MNSSKFAKLCKVEKRTLFYYDEIGLLKPARVLENGYRDYDLNQIERMDTIKIFQSCGFSLEEIKDILAKEDKTTDVLQAIDRLNHQIEQLQQQRLYLTLRMEAYQRLKNQEIDFIDTQIRYDKIAMDNQEHFFSFLDDGNNRNLFLDCCSREVCLYQQSENGKYQKKGSAVRFTISFDPDQKIDEIVDEKMKEMGLIGDGQYFIQIIPHLFLPQNLAAGEVITFLEKEGD